MAITLCPVPLTLFIICNIDNLHSGRKDAFPSGKIQYLSYPLRCVILFHPVYYILLINPFFLPSITR